MAVPLASVPVAGVSVAPRRPTDPSRVGRTLTAAASTAVRAPLTGPRRPATVLGAFGAAVYLQAGDDVLAVVAADAVRAPLALVVALPAATAGLAGCRGLASVGAGEVRVGSLTVRAVRWWEPARPVVAARPLLPAVRGLDAGLAERPLEPAVAGVAAALERSLTEADLPGLCQASAALVGRGGGLTPAGDDVLAGALVTLRALGARGVAGPMAGALASAVRRCLPATTSLSAALLRHAVDGLTAPEVAGVVSALGCPGRLSAALPPLLAVGSTSGSDLAHGVLLAARAVEAGGAS